MRNLLIIMAKYPTPGKVKTRLASTIGNRRAAEVYRSLLDHHVREFSKAPFDVEWRYAPARAPFRKFVVGRVTSRGVNGNATSGDVAYKPQPSGGLGERMHQIFRDSFARGYRRVVMIGTDAPEVTKATVRRAFRLLRTYRAVFQPTDDGGYALVGLSAMIDVFSRIAWSTDRVMAQTRRRLRANGIPFTELPATFDVDTVEDLRRLTLR